MKKQGASSRIPPIAHSGKKPLTPDQLRQAQQYWKAMGEAMKGKKHG